MIRDLTDDQVRAVLAAYEEMGGVAFGSLGAAVSPREDLKMLVGMASMQDHDPEALLRMLIARAQRTGFTTSSRESLRDAHEAPTSSPRAEEALPASRSAAERGQVKASTTVRMRHAAEHYGPEELLATLDQAPNLVQFSDIDGAMQIAIDVIVRRISDGRSEEARRYCGSTVITGYIVGRAMLGTVRGALHYSNPLTQADNVETLVRLSTSQEAAPYTNEIGPTGQLFMESQIEMAGRAGPLSSLAEEDRSNLAGGAAAIGLVLAVVEHDLFAA
ncbi:MAG: hypothetical protein ACRDWA_05150 [Acidimicrobiia bacterium]